jgi:hypothetical protein
MAASTVDDATNVRPLRTPRVETYRPVEMNVTMGDVLIVTGKLHRLVIVAPAV